MQSPASVTSCTYDAIAGAQNGKYESKPHFVSRIHIFIEPFSMAEQLDYVDGNIDGQYIMRLALALRKEFATIYFHADQDY